MSLLMRDFWVVWIIDWGATEPYGPVCPHDMQCHTTPVLQYLQVSIMDGVLAGKGVQQSHSHYVC